MGAQKTIPEKVEKTVHDSAPYIIPTVTMKTSVYAVRPSRSLQDASESQLNIWSMQKKSKSK